MKSRFLILTHVQHTSREEQYLAYGPYVREMNVWLRHVEKVEVVAPLSLPRGQEGSEEFRGKDPYLHENLTFTRIPSFHFLNLTGAVNAISKIPGIIFKIISAMKRADHLHLRCPGNIGLLACICQIFFPKKPKSAKYAGNWDPKAKQPVSYKFQKWILSNTFLTRNMQVLVYGEWPGQSENIKPFFTASFSEAEKQEVQGKNFEGPFTLLFVGNLVPGKHPLKAIQLVQGVCMELGGMSQKAVVKLEIYGDGPEMKMLKAYCRDENMEHLVDFKGSRPLEELKQAYQKAHFVILPSQSEGWPKAIAEGMFFGCIPISTSVSCVPWMLGYGSRGLVISSTSPKKLETGSEGGVEEGEWLKRTIEKVINDMTDYPQKMERKSVAAKDWSQQYTLERFEASIRDILKQRIIKNKP